MEEDEVVEIERATPKPQSVRILQKRGEEVVVVEEENTTREIKRLKSAFAGVMTQIEGIARTAKQWHQLMKRMEPLAEENKKLQEALDLSEKTKEEIRATGDCIQGDKKKNGELKSKSEQLDQKCKQLENVSKQKSEQDVELSQLRQTIEQIRQEKAKESERADKLAEELKDYRHKAKAQFDVLVQEAKVQKDNFNTVTTTIKPVLDYVDMELTPCPDGRQQAPDTIIQRCKAAWENFKNFNRDAVMTAATHALVVVRSHYPTVDI
ncbi:uncharacterized protein [Miscanthus floridulus]|uniref:uncharacterized protein n=1 Tax=Miscanthus floridulus TaxID=154761 RepID=UPI00345772A6